MLLHPGLVGWSLARTNACRHVHECGKGAGEDYTINVPLPPGSGSGAYRDAFSRVVVPALRAFAPQLVLVSSGFDAGFMDPLGSMMLSADDFRCDPGVACNAGGADTARMHARAPCAVKPVERGMHASIYIYVLHSWWCMCGSGHSGCSQI